MAQVWKEVLELKGGDQVVRMPAEAIILKVETQNDVPMVWFSCEPSAPIQPRKIFMVGTGHDFNPEGLIYLGTVKQFNDMYVWHFYERRTRFTPAAQTGR